MKKTSFLRLFSWLCMVAMSAIASAGLVPMDDRELGQQTGQALFMMDKQTKVTGGDTFTFYKMGLDAVMDINTNIRKLQLGCGGANGPGCDIDIDNLSLSGPENCPGGRPGCSAQLTRPFVEFAVKNDGVKTQREIIGWRLSAEKTLGLMTVGENTPIPNGIKTLSGYMVAHSSLGNATNCAGYASNNCIHGTAYTKPTNIGCGRSNAADCAGGIKDPFSTVLQFDTDPNILACTSGCYRGNTGTSAPGQSNGVYIPSLAVPFSAPGAVVNQSRATSTSVTALGNVPQVSLNGGQLFVNMETPISVAWFITVSNATVNMQGSVSGLKAQIDFSQNLGLIHKINVNSPFSLSFQKQAVAWPGAASADIAQRGWWMSFADPVVLGELNPVQQIDISPTFSQMATAFRQYFEANPIPISTNQGLQQLFNGEMTVNVGGLNIPSTLTMPVSDLQLGVTQNVVPNCWGTARFC